MPGWPSLTEADFGASFGYAAPVAEGPSHTAFIVWLLVIAIAAVAILGGLSAGGFSFLFKR